MLRSTLAARIHALGGPLIKPAACPLEGAADYIVRLESRAQAEEIARALLSEGADRIRRADAVGEGFLFVTLGSGAYAAALSELSSPLKTMRPEKILLEYVSADPHAPLTLTHARGGVIGDALSRILRAQGHTVRREFYVNDAPTAALKSFAKESSLSAAVALARKRQNEILAQIGVVFDGDVSEESLRASGAVNATLDALAAGGQAEMRGEALWLRSSALGDDQDRVLRRPGGMERGAPFAGEPTYLAGDLAYHRDKFARGFTRLVDVWDDDHRSYVARTHAGLRGLALSADALAVVVCGPIRVLRDGTEVRGGRYGSFVGLEEVLEDTSPTLLRFQLLSAPAGAPLDLSLDTSGSDELNAVRTACARLAALSRTDASASPDIDAILADLASAALLKRVLDYPQTILDAADALAPEKLTRFLIEVAALTVPIGASLDPALARAAHAALAGALTLLGLDDEEKTHV